MSRPYVPNRRGTYDVPSDSGTTGRPTRVAAGMTATYRRSGRPLPAGDALTLMVHGTLDSLRPRFNSVRRVIPQEAHYALSDAGRRRLAQLRSKRT